MAAEENARLVAEYERLRDRLFKLEALATAIDHRLVELERKLPEEYTYVRDMQVFRKTRP